MEEDYNIKLSSGKDIGIVTAQNNYNSLTNISNISVTNENGYYVISDNSDNLFQVKISNVNEDIYYDDRSNNANYVSNTITYNNSYNETYYDIFNDVFGYEYNKNLLQLI